jgi:putative hemolysin
MVEPPLGLGISGVYVLAAGGATGSLGISGIYLQITVIVVCITLVAFFSSAEASLISVNKLRIRYLVQQGNRSAQVVTRVLEHHEKFFATILLTENAFIIFASSLGTAVAISLVQGNDALVLLAPLVMTVVIVAFGEITPKTLAAGSAERWSLFVARPVSVIMYLETFVIYLFTLMPRFLVKVMGKEQGLWASSVTEGELRMLIDISKAEGAVDEGEADLLEKIFNFGDRQMREIMIPRPEFVMVELNATLEEFLPIYSEHSHTRFPVYDDSMENVVGVLSSKDVLLAIGQKKLNPQDNVTSVLRPAFFVPETKTVSSTFSEMQQGGNGMVLMVDEFGGIAGLATVKQLLEVIVGQVTMEDDESDESYIPVDENTYRLDAGVGIPEINEELNLGLPDGDYQTVAGFILDRLGRIPEEGDVVEFEDLKLIVKEMSGVKIETVELKRAVVEADGDGS